MNWENHLEFVSLEEVEKAIQFCEDTSCENCPIAIEGIEHRSNYEKQVLHVPCVENLVYELAKRKTLN